jgi:Tol biopolymer transport system component
MLPLRRTQMTDPKCAHMGIGRLASVAAVCVMTAITGIGTAPASAQETSPSGKLVFASNAIPELNPAGDIDVFTMNADGTDPVNLTETPEDVWEGPHDLQPRWSPDGSQIAWISYRDGGWDGEIWVMNADGSEKQQLTDNSYEDFDPAWSADGEKIAWTVEDLANFDYDIWVSNADGSNPTDIIGEGPDDLQFYERQPDWTADGRIVYSGTEWIEEAEGTYSKIAMMNADGSNVQSLSERLDPTDGVPNHDEFPAVSPDGAWIAFMQNPQPEQGWDIVVLRTSDGAQFNLTNTYWEQETGPMWSPDGTMLLFVSSVSSDLYYISVDDFPTGAGTAKAAARAGALPYERFTSVGGIESADWHGDDFPPPAPGRCTRTGTEARDTLRGTAARDVICGLGGGDRIVALGGNDRLIGGRGPDALYGGRGDDLLKGGPANDDLRGGPGADRCVQGVGTGTVVNCEAQARR